MEKLNLSDEERLLACLEEAPLCLECKKNRTYHFSKLCHVCVEKYKAAGFMNLTQEYYLKYCK